MKKIKLCSVNEVPETKPKCMTLEDTYFAVFRHKEEFIVIKDECPHQMASFEGQSNVEGILTCSFHGWSFNLETGDAHKGFGCLKKYQVSVSNEEIWIDFIEDENVSEYQKAFIK